VPETRMACSRRQCARGLAEAQVKRASLEELPKPMLLSCHTRGDLNLDTVLFYVPGPIVGSLPTSALSRNECA